MNDQERQRRHDEHWQGKVLDGMARTLTVLHDISDGIRLLNSHIARPLARPAPITPETSTELPKLLSVADLAEYLGIPAGAIRNLQTTNRGPNVTRLGNRLYFQRDDVNQWLNDQRQPVRTVEHREWKTAHLPGSIGASFPSSSKPATRIYCRGSNTEPAAASQYSGRGICRHCHDHPLVNNDGRLRKHYPV